VSARAVERTVAVASAGTDWLDPVWATAARASAACRRCLSFLPRTSLGGWCVENAETTKPDSSCAQWTPTPAGVVVATVGFRVAEAEADANRHTCPACGVREAVLVLDFAPDGTSRARGVCRACDWRDA
jgi:hypothetical protein